MLIHEFRKDASYKEKNKHLLDALPFPDEVLFQIFSYIKSVYFVYVYYLLYVDFQVCNPGPGL